MKNIYFEGLILARVFMIRPDDGLIILFSFQHSLIKLSNSDVWRTSKESFGRKGDDGQSGLLTLSMISVNQVIILKIQMIIYSLVLKLHYKQLLQFQCHYDALAS
jgi:hypothetical protein